MKKNFHILLIIPGCQRTPVAVERTLTALQPIYVKPRFSAW